MVSLKMSPSFFSEYSIYDLMPNAIVRSHVPEKLAIFLSYFLSLFMGKMKDSRPISPLKHHVGHIVFWRSNKEVLWIYTHLIIAFVTNKKPSRNFAAMNFPGGAMGRYSSPAAPPSSHLPISIFAHSTKPLPAMACFLNLRQKSLSDGPHPPLMSLPPYRVKGGLW